jgi:hypothetical protein
MDDNTNNIRPMVKYKYLWLRISFGPIIFLIYILGLFLVEEHPFACAVPPH